jgi:hypothetical protein
MSSRGLIVLVSLILLASALVLFIRSSIAAYLQEARGAQG